MKKLVTLITFCLMCLFSFAQGNVEVKGKVTDENGQAIAKAEVVINNTTHTLTTNEKGEFSINLPEGKYVIKVSKLAYGTKRVVLEVVSDTQVDVSLEKIKRSKTSRA